VAGREDVENAAAQREVARVLHERHPMIAPLDQPARQRIRSDRLSRDDVGDRFGEDRPREAALQPGLGSRDDHRRRRLDEVIEALHAGRHGLARR